MPLNFSASGAAVATAAAGGSVYSVALRGGTNSTNSKATLKEIGVGFSGIAAADKPYLVQVVRHTGTVNTSNALSENALDSLNTQASRFDAHDTVTWTGGAETVLYQTTVHPQTRMTWAPPFGCEVNVSANEAIAVKVTTQASGTGSISSYGTVVWSE